MPCITTCTLVDITTADDCNLKGGIKIAFWTLESNVDWATTASTPAQFNTTTQIISGYTMNGAAVWNTITFKRKGSLYTQAYTSEQQFYDVNITNIFEGKGSTLRNALVGAISCCKIAYHAFDNNCESRLFGKDWDGNSFNDYIETLRIRQHDDNSGDFGGDLPSDTVIFGGEAETPALYSDITQSAFIAAYT